MEPIIREIKRYVEATEIDEKVDKAYQIGINDILALCEVADRDTCGAVCYSYLFGRAMGYRAARDSSPL